MKLTIGITTYEEDIFLQELLYVLRNELMQNNLEQKVEIIITNDFGNNPRTMEIIEENNDILKFIKLSKNSKTPAVGRNEIIKNAQGEYVLFIDGDDNFVTSLKTLVEELESKEPKDIFVSEVQKIAHDGIILPSPFIYTEQLFGCSDAEFEKNHHKLVVHQTGIWSVYRTEFLKENELYYDEEKRYEDNLLMTDIALCDKTRYGRLQTKYYGWRTNFKSFSNADIDYVVQSRLSLYQETLKKVKSNSESKFAPYLVFSVWNQTYSNILRNYPVMSQEKYQEFYTKLNKITTENQELITELRAKQEDFIDIYYKIRKFRIFDSFNWIKLGQTIHKLYSNKGKVKKKLIQIMTLLPLNKKKIFMTSQYGKYNDNTKYLYLQMKNDPEYQNYKFVFAVKDKSLLENPDFIDYDNKLLFYYHHYTAKYIYFNTWYAADIKKRPKQIWTQLWHGIPYKKVYKDIETFEQTTAPVKVKDKEKSILNWDNVWSVNEYNTKIFKNLFPIANIIEKEYPKTQWLIDNQNNDQLIANLKAKYRLDSSKKYILYAPTYRPYMFNININEVEKLVPEGWELLIHPHPLIKIANISISHNLLENIEDIQEIILITDGVITDYSSIAYDYAQTNKKVINYTPDLDVYNSIHGLYEKELRCE